MRHLRRVLLFAAALIFLFEAWLWDAFTALGRALARVLPFEQTKQAIARVVHRLPPYGALAMFVIPAGAILPFKIIALYLIARGHVVLGGSAFVAAKLVGFGITAFLFDLTRDTLLRLTWFARLFDWLVRARAWAHGFVDPYTARIRQQMHELRVWALSLMGEERSGLMRMVLRLRGRIRRARS